MAGKPKIKSTLSSTSKTPIVKGVPSQLLFFGDLFLNLDDYLSEIVTDSLNEEIALAKKGLIEAEPAYKEIADDFRIKYDNESQTFSYTVLKRSADKAHALEYGPPARSLLRHQCIAGSKRLSSSISKRLDIRTGMRTHL
jgi:hypothetical protein